MEEIASDRIAGCLLGMAMGDALGLPREGLSPQRAARLFGGPPIDHRFAFGRGMVSDDTEHACMTVQALLHSGGDPERFVRALAWRLRWWLAKMPAGVGWATLRSLCRLWLGFGPARSGVYSAGNGPAMRAPVIGLFAGHDPTLLRRLIRASTRMTHTDPRAEEGAFLVALSCHRAAQGPPGSLSPSGLLAELRGHVATPAFTEVMDAIGEGLSEGLPAGHMAARMALERGVTGYIVHTVAMSLYCWLRRPGSFRDAVEQVIMLGGDTDTTGAITGALAGTSLGASAIPSEWIAGLLDWPWSVHRTRRLAECLAKRLADGDSGGHGRIHGVHVTWMLAPVVFLRNIGFAVIVLFHGLRRLFPPY